MKFIVNELPNFYDDCPFSKEEWKSGSWIVICTLMKYTCNLHNNRYVTECYGLKELKGTDND
jgi:hypothetical protein